jgi:hypothetical protein
MRQRLYGQVMLFATPIGANSVERFSSAELKILRLGLSGAFQ